MAPDRLASTLMTRTSERSRCLRPAASAAATMSRRLRHLVANAAVAGFCMFSLAYSQPLSARTQAPEAPPAHGATEAVDSPAELIGKPARAWTFTRWVDTAPLTLQGLRGKVVLVRWFSPECRYCKASLPSIEKLRKRYASQGLVVVCVYHPKPMREVSDKEVRDGARQLGYTGPLALDQEWSTLNRWWLMNHPGRNWTSVSFLIDQQGIVRWGQGGGEYHPSGDPNHAACAARYAELERTIRELLAVSSAAN